VAGIGAPLWYINRTERDEERLEELRAMNRANYSATGEYMTEVGVTWCGCAHGRPLPAAMLMWEGSPWCFVATNTAFLHTLAAGGDCCHQKT